MSEIIQKGREDRVWEQFEQDGDSWDDAENIGGNQKLEGTTVV